MFTNLRFREETCRGMIGCVTIFVLAGWTISCFLITNVNHKGCAMYVHGGGISLSDLGNSYAKWTEENETDLFRPCLNPTTLRSPVFDLERHAIGRVATDFTV